MIPAARGMYNTTGDSTQPSNGASQQARPFIQQPIHPQQSTFGSQYASQQQTERRDLGRPSIHDRIQNIIPPPMSIELLNNVKNMSVLQLCQVGRDITQEITIRLLNILTVFQASVDRRRSYPPLDTEAIITYAKLLFRKLQEIRIRIDKARTQISAPMLDEDTFFKEITNPDPVEPRPGTSATQNALIEQFETNRTKIVELNNKIKKLEWYSTVIDFRLQP